MPGRVIAPWLKSHSSLVEDAVLKPSFVFFFVWRTFEGQRKKVILDISHHQVLVGFSCVHLPVKCPLWGGSSQFVTEHHVMLMILQQEL